MPEIRLAGLKKALFTLRDLEIDEFVPVVKIDSANFNSDKLAALLKGDKIELAAQIDASMRRVEMDFVVAVPGEMVVTCMVAKGRKASLDDDGIITPRLVGKVPGVTVKALEEGKARYGQPYRFSVKIEGSAERTFQVELFANDDAQDANSGEFKDVFCGRIEVRTWPDVFSKADADRLTEEMEFIAPFNDAGRPAEYAISYCMHAAERGISRLLENKVDFYSVDRTHKRENEIALAGERAGLRGDYFMKSGFVKTKIESDDFIVDMKIVTATKTEADYKANCYYAVSLPPGTILARKLRETFEVKPGFHVYYLSVSDDYHTLVLIINNHDLSRKRYEIYDQDGLTSSHGPLLDLESGLERQTSWSFLHFYKEKGFSPKKICSTKIRLWKIQRKP